jgi:ribosomal protein S27AE
MNDDKDTVAVDQWAGKCPNCGPVAVEVEFPEGGVCGECGAELDRIAFFDEGQGGVRR